MITTSTQYDNRRTVGVRLSVAGQLVAACFLALVVSFWIFQVAEHGKFREMAENNHLRTLPLRAPRGATTATGMCSSKTVIQPRYRSSGSRSRISTRRSGRSSG